MFKTKFLDHGEKEFSQLNGVVETEVGWVNYQSQDQTSRVEVVKIIYDTSLTTMGNLISSFWDIHDGTNPSNADPNNVERSVLIATDESTRDQMQHILDHKKKTEPDVLTIVAMFREYTRAPEKDQKYYLK